MSARIWTVRGMAGTLVLLCAARGVVGQSPSSGGGKVVATVNGEDITVAELDALLKRDGPMAVSQPEEVRKKDKQVALDALINETLLRQFLKQNVPSVPDKELDARMADLVVSLKQHKQTLEEFCRDQSKTPKQLRDGVAAVLQWNYYARKNLKDQDLMNYYRENKDWFDKVLVKASEIMLRVPMQGGDSERAKARTQLTELRRKLVEGTPPMDFAAAAKEISQGPTKDRGGDLDYFPYLKGYGVVPDSVLKTAFKLPPGQISEVIDSEFGVHIIKVVDRKPGEPSDFNKVKEEVRQMCVEGMQQVILQQLRKTAQVKILVP
jgi:parvulin-like peptidyl-prolyl isomerase